MAAGDTLVNASGSFNSSGGNNTIVGSSSGSAYVNAEDSNILIGSGVLGTANENNVLRIGMSTGTGNNQINKAIVCGITGITVAGSAVFVNSSNQLGVLLSTRRIKDNIQDMGDYSSRVLKLRPVTFTYTQVEEKSIQSGLIAEEVMEVMPELVIQDTTGLPQTVRYHELSTLILNELIKTLKIVDDLMSRLTALESKQ